VFSKLDAYSCGVLEAKNLNLFLKNIMHLHLLEKFYYNEMFFSHVWGLLEETFRGTICLNTLPSFGWPWPLVSLQFPVTG